VIRESFRLRNDQETQAEALKHSWILNLQRRHDNTTDPCSPCHPLWGFVMKMLGILLAGDPSGGRISATPLLVLEGMLST
jgi:hypothetical protein